MCHICIIIESATCRNVNISKSMFLIRLSVSMVLCCYFLGVYVSMFNRGRSVFTFLNILNLYTPEESWAITPERVPNVLKYTFNPSPNNTADCHNEIILSCFGDYIVDTKKSNGITSFVGSRI